MRKLKLGITLTVLTITAGVVGSITLFNGNSKAHAAVSSLNVQEMKTKYNMNFNPSNNTSQTKISETQAISIAGKFIPIHPNQTQDATFGYLTLSSHGSPLPAPGSIASKINKGVITNYPVWVVRTSDVKLPDLGGVTKGSPRKMASSTGQLYTFIDAANGQIIFATTIN